MKNNCFDRPIIILSAPRSGSTLLYEVLSKNRHLSSIGGESHAVIESIPGLNIAARKFDSNELTADDASPEVIRRLHQGFLQNLKSSTGSPLEIGLNDNFRFLEKTPKNSLRIDFLNKAFPDAMFVYLVRDPRDNVSSIMQAWRSNRFRTYPQLPGWNGDWSLLLPKNWKSLLGKPIEQIAAFQWSQANNAIVDSLNKLPSERWKIVRYEQLIDDPSNTVKAICDFCQIPFDDNLATLCDSPLPHSQYTLSAPKKDKWLANYKEVKSIWPNLSPVIARLNEKLTLRKLPLLPLQWQEFEMERTTDLAANSKTDYANVSRNAACPCGSTKRFKHCHGQLN